MERSPAVGRITAEAPTAAATPGTWARPAPGDRFVPVALAVVTIAVQIAHPLLSGGALHAATISAVVLFTGATITHAATTRGPAAAVRLLLVTGGLGLLAEAVGVATGVPFGAYRYTGTLGVQVAGVPVIVPLAWTMMAYPCLLVGRRLATSRTAAVAVGAWTLAAWDLFLDPQMVADGHWTWLHPTPALPGVPGVPLTNQAGWLLVAAVITAALDRALPRDDDAAGRAVAAPALLLGWTWIGSAVGNLVFFGRPAVAVYGTLAMGVTVLPYLLSLRDGASAGAGGRRPAVAA